MIKHISTITKQSGVTIIETIVVIAIMVILSSVLVANFPKLQKELALSHASYIFAQNLKKTEEMAIASVEPTDSLGNIIETTGYGVYIDAAKPTQTYLVYADINGDGAYTGLSLQYCNKQVNPEEDCAIGMYAVGESDSDVYIKRIENVTLPQVSITFIPPDPRVTISNLTEGAKEVVIVLGLKTDTSLEQKVLVNTIGVIQVNK